EEASHARRWLYGARLSASRRMRPLPGRTRAWYRSRKSTMPVDHARRSAVAAIPAQCYARPAWKGLAYLGRAAALYAVSVAGLLATDAPLAVMALWLLGGLAIGALFVLGHDAAHGALFDSPRLCRRVGRLALLASLHAYEPWVVGHNRIHHGHTGDRGFDFVWHPLTKTEYDALPRLARLLHRIEWTPWGAGLYYLRVLWWQRMMRLVPSARHRRAFRRDRLLVLAYLGLVSLALVWGGAAHGGTIASGCWTWVKVFAVPWLVWNQLIGTTVYLHHIGPDIVWRERGRSRRWAGQIESTVNFRIPAWLNVFWQNIFLHVPHHVDPRIPFYALPRAAEALTTVLGREMRGGRLRVATYVATTRRCKLYDFEHGRWLGYDGAVVPTSSPSRSMGAATAR
ncbi:MAG: fatty acid desaturase, partial [Candidatus Binatia bacterium]